MINLSALSNLTRSRTLRLLFDSLLLADWLLLCSLPSVLTFIKLSYFTSNILTVVWATIKTANHEFLVKIVNFYL